MSNAPDIYTTGRGFLAALEGESDAVTEMLTIAVAIADQSARFDIEFGCATVVLGSGEWVDTGTPSPEVTGMPEDARDRYRVQLLRAMRYLELRGQLVRHGSFPNLLRYQTEEATH